MRLRTPSVSIESAGEFSKMRAPRFRRIRQAERVVERMDVERVRPMQRVEIVIGLEHVAHALGRPALDVGAELLAVEPRRRQHLVAVVDLGHFEPARHRGDARHALICDCRGHIFEPHLGERPQRLGVIHSDAGDHPVHGLGEARQHEAVVAAGGVPGDAAGLQHRHRPAAAGDLARGREPGETGADHADIDVEIEGERPALGCRHHGRGVPARRVGRPLGRVHVFVLSVVSGQYGIRPQGGSNRRCPLI